MYERVFYKVGCFIKCVDPYYLGNCFIQEIFMVININLIF